MTGLTGCLILGLMVGCWAAYAQDKPAAAPPVDPEVAQKLTLAEGHHDLAILYIKKGDLDLAVAEAREIIQLQLPPAFEKPVVQSLSIISEKLADLRRFDLGQALLDEALRTAQLSTNRALILRNKARLYMLAGDNDKAIDSWRKALDLEARRPR